MTLEFVELGLSRLFSLDLTATGPWRDNFDCDRAPSAVGYTGRGAVMFRRPRAKVPERRESVMTKAELIEKVATAHKGQVTKKVASAMVDAVFANVAGAIKKNKRFSFPGFGTFVVRQRKARKGRNPQTGEAIKIKASKTVGFKPSLELKKGL